MYVDACVQGRVRLPRIRAVTEKFRSRATDRGTMRGRRSETDRKSLYFSDIVETNALKKFNARRTRNSIRETNRRRASEGVRRDFGCDAHVCMRVKRKRDSDDDIFNFYY